MDTVAQLGATHMTKDFVKTTILFLQCCLSLSVSVSVSLCVCLSVCLVLCISATALQFSP